MAIALACAGCSFQTHAVTDDARPPDGALRDDAPLDAAIDGPPAAPYMIACSIDTLYHVDVDSGMATLAGPIGDNMDAIAGVPVLLYGIPSSTNKIYTTDSSTGNVFASHSLMPNKPYYGFTYVPAGEVGVQALWLAGTGETAGGSLYSINPMTGMATVIGPFGGGLGVAGDLAWVSGDGLYATMYGPSCTTTTCIAKIDPSSGAATVITTSGPQNALALSGYRGQLWALDNAGGVWAVNTSTGNATLAFTTAIAWSDAAQ